MHQNMTVEELKHRCRTYPSPYDIRDIPFAAVAIPLAEIPDEFSLREQQTPVKSQGNVGSCCAFAACAVDEFLHRDPNVNPDIDLSERHLYCRRSNKPEPGMYPRDAAKLLKKEGVCYEFCWHYIPDANRLCEGQPCENVLIQAEQFRISAYHRVFSALKSVLFTYKAPILIVAPVYENWVNIGADGIVPMPDNSKFIGYHALTLTGYNKKFFECKNSWGDFGNDGYLFLPCSYPIIEGWVYEKEEPEPEPDGISILSYRIDTKPSIFGLPISFEIYSPVKCWLRAYSEGKKIGFPKRISTGINHVRIYVPFKLGKTSFSLFFASRFCFNDDELLASFSARLVISASLSIS